MRDIVWRPRAHLDRESIAIYLGVERDSPHAALNAKRRIDEALETARLLPDSGGHFRHDNLDHEYRTMLAGAYIVFYRYDEEAITVYRVLHQRQDFDTYTLTGL